MKICNRCLENKTIDCFHKKGKSTKAVCKECIKKESAIYRLKNKNIRKEKNKTYYIKNKNKINSRNKKWKQKNQKKLYISNTIWRNKNKEKIQKRQREYASYKYHNDSNHKIAHILRVRLNKAISRDSKKTSAINLMGCTLDELKIHLEKQFVNGMNWYNQGDWHIDHIKPCASFDLTKEDEQRKCFHYSNLQPLWAFDNLIKSDKIIY